VTEVVAAAAARPLLIFPFNGNGLEALDCLGGEFRLLGFVDDTPEKQGQNPCGYAVLSRSALGQWPEAHVLAVPGGPASFRSRRAVIKRKCLRCLAARLHFGPAAPSSKR
jgi:hypothetical protein